MYEFGTVSATSWDVLVRTSSRLSEASALKSSVAGAGPMSVGTPVAVSTSMSAKSSNPGSYAWTRTVDPSLLSPISRGECVSNKVITSLVDRRQMASTSCPGGVVLLVMVAITAPSSEMSIWEQQL